MSKHDTTLPLRGDIIAVLNNCAVAHQQHADQYRQAITDKSADAILALFRRELTSDEAVEAAWACFGAALAEKRTFEMRDTILAALDAALDAALGAGGAGDE